MKLYFKKQEFNNNNNKNNNNQISCWDSWLDKGTDEGHEYENTEDDDSEWNASPKS